MGIPSGQWLRLARRSPRRLALPRPRQLRQRHPAADLGLAPVGPTRNGPCP